MIIITDLKDFLEKREKQEIWLKTNHIVKLIEEEDPSVGSFINENYFSWSGSDLMDLNLKLPVKLKKKLKKILRIHDPEMISRLESMSFLFEKKFFKN